MKSKKERIIWCVNGLQGIALATITSKHNKPFAFLSHPVQLLSQQQLHHLTFSFFALHPIPRFVATKIYVLNTNSPLSIRFWLYCFFLWFRIACIAEVFWFHHCLFFATFANQWHGALWIRTDAIVQSWKKKMFQHHPKTKTKTTLAGRRQRQFRHEEDKDNDMCNPGRRKTKTIRAGGR